MLSVAAATSLRAGVEALLAEFREANPGVGVSVTYGSSGSLFAQIANRAPFDFFLSADIDYPRKLIEDDLAIRNSLFRYARGSLVLWVRNESMIDPNRNGMDTLTQSNVRRIAIANPRLAPYGAAAESAIRKYGVYERVGNKLVMAENIGQAAQFAESGAVDVAIIAKSLANAPPLESRGRFWPVPDDMHPAIMHEGVILKRVVDQAAANGLRSFILSQRGQEILHQYGFNRPGD
ncbi:MAG: molybdate ABC transporter substrate-binding protein [Planctomycetes bacterium]|nr:molybdate ABC transporter substrate-binding protein [Planctomycetota bacterium]